MCGLVVKCDEMRRRFFEKMKNRDAEDESFRENGESKMMQVKGESEK